MATKKETSEGEGSLPRKNSKKSSWGELDDPSGLPQASADEGCTASSSQPNLKEGTGVNNAPPRSRSFCVAPLRSEFRTSSSSSSNTHVPLGPRRTTPDGSFGPDSLTRSSAASLGSCCCNLARIRFTWAQYIAPDRSRSGIMAEEGVGDRWESSSTSVSQPRSTFGEASRGGGGNLV